MPRNMLSDTSDDTTSTLSDMSALSDVEEALLDPMEQYNKLRLELGMIKREYNKYARPDLRRVYWQKLPPLIAKMNTLKSQINALELQLKDQLL